MISCATDPALQGGEEFELKPNGAQQRQMRRFTGSCRFVYSRALALQKALHEFQCVACGFEDNADVVGAINVLRAGHARFACEVSGAAMPPAAGTHRSDLLPLDAATGAVGITVL